MTCNADPACPGAPGFLAAAALLLLACAMPARAEGADALTVCATTPDLAALAREVGGTEVEATAFTRGPQDPHYLEARPSFIRTLSRADLLLIVGLDLESGWLPVLLRSARNSRILPGGAGYLDASTVIRPLQVPTTVIDRSMGHLHALGNPHYLLDPLNGLRVATRIRDLLAKQRPGRKTYFDARLAEFRRRVGISLLGEKLVASYEDKDLGRLLILLERGGRERFRSFLEKQGESELLGGWLASTSAVVGRKVVADHNLWPYLADRFGFEVIEFLEPKPGVAPTTRHLAVVLERMESQGANVILACPYFNTRYAKLLASRGKARIAEMAHQVGAREGTGSYLETVDHNVEQLVRAVEGAR